MRYDRIHDHDDVIYCDTGYTYLPISTNLCHTSKGLVWNSLSITTPSYRKDVGATEVDIDVARDLRTSPRLPPLSSRVEGKLRREKDSTSPL